MIACEGFHGFHELLLIVLVDFYVVNQTTSAVIVVGITHLCALPGWSKKI